MTFKCFAMKLPSIPFWLLSIVLITTSPCAFYIGYIWSVPCNHSMQQCIHSHLEECDKRTKDIDSQLDTARQLEEAAIQLKAVVGGGGGWYDAALPAVQRVIAFLDPRYALSRDDHLLRSAASADACGEEFKGAQFGSPYYREGFFPAADCRRSDKPPLQALLTALLLAPPHAPRPGSAPDGPLAALRAQHPRLHAVAAVAHGRPQPSHAQTTAVAATERDWATPGALLNRLVAKARTPYVLVVRDAVRVDELARLERLIYVISVLGGAASNASDYARRDKGEGGWGVAIAGGAVRDPLGRWSAGCAETRMRNYALHVRSGYRYSVLDCMLCHTLRGPFVARTNLLREVAFDERLPPAVVFEDWFLRVKRRGALAAVCPDALFFVGGGAEGEDGPGGGSGAGAGRDAWRHLAAAWQVDSVHLPGRPPMRFSCEEVQLSCEVYRLMEKSLLIPTCCLTQVAGALAAFDDFAKRHNLEYELIDGTMLGAAKLQNMLPWDIDADLIFRSNDLEKYKDKQNEMHESGYSFKQFTDEKRLKYFQLVTPSITIEMLGKKNMTSFLLPKEMQNIPTRMKMFGIWMQGPWNPGLMARNHYGPAYLKHAQHWRKFGLKPHTDRYASGSWKNCSLPNHHACLNLYPADGSFSVLPERCTLF